MVSIKTVSITPEGDINVKVEQPGSELNVVYPFKWLMKIPFVTFESIFKDVNHGCELVQSLKDAYIAKAAGNGNNDPFSCGPKITKPSSWKFRQVVTESTSDSISNKLMDMSEAKAGVGEVDTSSIEFKRNIDME